MSIDIEDYEFTDNDIIFSRVLRGEDENGEYDFLAVEEIDGNEKHFRKADIIAMAKALNVSGEDLKDD